MSELEVLAKQIEANQRWLADRLDEICRLIEHGPEVDMAFVAKHLRKLTMRYDATPTPQDYIDMLCEARVTVRGAK